ncbi:MAG: hypothetical protein O8C64_15745 [Candidatus Methanoperedens sp.]|nr:hypothetical protein [Candidatus Methanoperedens sp.]
MKKFLFLIIIFIILIPLIDAKKSDEYIAYNSNKIFEACKGNNITLSYNWLKLSNGTLTNNLPWPYEFDIVNSIFKKIVSIEPYTTCQFGRGTVSCSNLGGDNPYGFGILKCGNNVLDVNGIDYFWNGEKLEVPRYVNNTAINNQGNLVQGSENSNITQNQMNTEINNLTLNLQESKKENFWLSYIYPIFQSLILSMFSYLVINPKSNKKQRIITSICCFGLILFISYLIVYLFKLII